MSVVQGETIVAFNLKLGKMDKTNKEAGLNRPMIVEAIFKYEPSKEGGKNKYRFSGIDKETGDKMSLFCGEEVAKAASKELKLSIQLAPKKEVAEKKPAVKKATNGAKKPAAKKPAAKSKKPKEESEDEEESEEEESEEEEESSEEEVVVPKKPTKKAPAKKAEPETKKAPAKKAEPETKKAPVKKAATKKAAK